MSSYIDSVDLCHDSAKYKQACFALTVPSVERCELGTDIPIHRHPDKDESFVILRGKVRSTTYNDDGSVIDSVVLSHEDGIYGVDIPQGVWHKHESLEQASVIFECKEGPYEPQSPADILTV